MREADAGTFENVAGFKHSADTAATFRALPLIGAEFHSVDCFEAIDDPGLQA